MNNQELKTVLHQQIDQADSQFLHVLHAVSEAYTQKQQTKIDTIRKIATSPADDWINMTNDLQKKAKKSRRKIKPAKRLYSLEDLEKNMEVW